MSDAVSIQVAQAIADEINAAAEAGEFAIGKFVCRRSYVDWDEKFSDLSCMQVDVVYTSHSAGGGSTIQLDNYASLLYRVPIDIAIRKRFDPCDRDPDTNRLKNEPVDELVTLLQELHELFATRRNSGVTPLTAIDANWIDADVLSWVNQRKLRAGLFEGVIRIMFHVSRESVPA